MKVNTILFLLFLSLFSAHSTLFAEELDDYVYMTESYPPWNYVEEGRVVGISPELLRHMWRVLDIDEQPIEILPWARGYKKVKEQQKHVLMTMVRTKGRESLFRWVGPISSTRYALIARKNSGVDIHNLEQAKSLKVAVIRDDATEQMLLDENFPLENLFRVNNIESAIGMLSRQHVDALVYDERSFFQPPLHHQHNIKNFRVLMLLKEEHDYFAFHRDTPDSVIRRFQGALEAVPKEHGELLQKYLR